jgi:hypothetical protein
MTFGPDGDDAADRGVWMSIWVDDVDAVHRRCLEQGLDVTWPPTDMSWNVREMHVRPRALVDWPVIARLGPVSPIVLCEYVTVARGSSRALGPSNDRPERQSRRG